MRHQHHLLHMEGAASINCCSEKSACSKSLSQPALLKSLCRSWRIKQASPNAGYFICFTPNPSLCCTSLSSSPLAHKEKQREEMIVERCCSRTRWSNSPKPWHCVSFCNFGIFISSRPPWSHLHLPLSPCLSRCFSVQLSQEEMLMLSCSSR